MLVVYFFPPIKTALTVTNPQKGIHHFSGGQMEEEIITL